MTSPPPRPRRVRLRDVAAAADVDASIASRVLRNDPRVSVRADTRQRILDAALMLDYRANPAAQTLSTARTRAIGLLVPNLANPATASIAEGADERARAAGYLLLLATGAPSERLPMFEGRVDGVLIANATSETEIVPDDGTVPKLLVNRRSPGGVKSIVVDDEAGGRAAVEYLVSLGHAAIGHVTGPQNSDTGRRRQAGFEQAMRTAGLEVREEWVAEGAYNEAGGSGATQRLLRTDPRPTAIFVSNLLATVGAMAAARRLGVSIPEELSLVTFDDVELAAYLDPPVTTVRLPLVDLGRQAVESMLGLLNGHTVGDTIVDTAPELVLRRSAAPPPAVPAR